MCHRPLVACDQPLEPVESNTGAEGPGAPTVVQDWRSRGPGAPTAAIIYTFSGDQDGGV